MTQGISTNISPLLCLRRGEGSTRAGAVTDTVLAILAPLEQLGHRNTCDAANLVEFQPFAAGLWM